MTLEGKELVQVLVDGIYAIRGIEDEDSKYFMLYNGEELNVIERLIKAGLIEEKVQEEIQSPTDNNLINNGTINTVTNSIQNNNVE